MYPSTSIWKTQHLLLIQLHPVTTSTTKKMAQVHQWTHVRQWHPAMTTCNPHPVCHILPCKQPEPCILFQSFLLLCIQQHAGQAYLHGRACSCATARGLGVFSSTAPCCDDGHVCIKTYAMNILVIQTQAQTHCTMLIWRISNGTLSPHPPQTRLAKNVAASTAKHAPHPHTHTAKPTSKHLTLEKVLPTRGIYTSTGQRAIEEGARNVTQGLRMDCSLDHQIHLCGKHAIAFPINCTRHSA